MCAAILAAVMAFAVTVSDMKLIGPAQVEVRQTFEVSVEGLHLDLSIFADGSAPPQVEWRIVPENGSIRSRLEVLIVMDETTKKPKWVVSPYTTIMLAEQGKVGIVLMVVQEEVGTLLVHEIIVGSIPDPEPPDPPVPPPDQKWQIVIVYESDKEDNLPRSQQVILNSLTFRKALEAIGHYLLEGGIIDQHIRDKNGKVPKILVPFFQACVDKMIPRICLAPIDGGEVLDYPLPLTETAVFELLRSPPAKGKNK